ncbi:MAG: Hpt domain-containing protein [Planctomycetota bacterium]
MALQEKLLDARSEVEPSHAEAATTLEQAADMVEQVVLREIEDVQNALEFISDSVEYLGKVLETLDSDQPADDLPAPTPGSDGICTQTAPSGDVSGERYELDPELVGAWVAECEHTLPELESIILTLEDTQGDPDVLDDVRRRVHTIKGECGIISLDTASRICHEAESAIDRCLDQNRPFPVDELLELMDWLKRYVHLFADDPSTQHEPPAYDALLASFESFAIHDPTPTAPEVQGEAISDVLEYDEPEDANEPIAFGDIVQFDETLSEFVVESRDHLLNAEAALLQLEDDPTNSDLINSVFRGFHTIKGCAGFLHLDPLVEIAHVAETLLDKIRQAEVALTSECISLLLESSDLMSRILGFLEGESESPLKGDAARLTAMLQHVTDGGSLVTSTGVKPVEVKPIGEILCNLGLATSEQIDEALDSKHANAGLLHDLLAQAGLENAAAIEEAFANGDRSAVAFREMLLGMGVINEDQLEEAIEAKKKSGQKLGRLLGLSPEALIKTMREQRQQMRDASGGQSAPRVRAVGVTESPPARQATAEEQASTGMAIKQGKNARANQTVKVNTARMDGLVDMVGELVIAHQMVVQDDTIQAVNEQRTQRNLTHVGKIIRDLQEVAMSLRMVTVKSTFQRMARLVRDLSSKSGKDIRFVMEGEDTELDRNVVEEIADPLVHMIRNACDHGLEPPDERNAAGKHDTGTLTLRAFHQSGSIVIEVEDDGRGLSREKILSKAVEKGLVPQDKDLSEISDYEVYNMIFLPGFSTADKITDVSGRGVGMDVVRRNIEALRGKAEIRSTPGRGSTFVMRLPLTMAIIDGMVVRVGSQRYVVPTLAIEQSYRPTADEIHTVVGRGEMARVRGSLLPIYRLNKVFGLSEGIDDLQEALLLVLEANDSRCSLVVDEILGQQQVVIKSLGHGIKSIRGVSGGAILGDGKVAPIVDVAGLVSEATKQEAA